MRWPLLVLLVLSCPLAAATSHPLYAGFSAPEQFTVIGGVSVTDTVVYRQAWYASDSDASWTSLTLGGPAYLGSQEWIAGTATASLPAFGPGEHYVIVYSCTYGGGWDCYGGWQLRVVNAGVPPSGESLYLVREGEASADIVVSDEAPPMVRLAAQYLQKYVARISGATLPISDSPSPSYGSHVYVGASVYTDALGVNADGCVHGGFRMVAGADDGNGDGYLILLGDDAQRNMPGFDGVPGPTTWDEWDALVYGKWGEQYQWNNDIMTSYGTQLNGDYGVREADRDGSMNAVSEFLYDQGVRWYHPGWYEYPGLGTIIPTKTDIGFYSTDVLVNPDFMEREFILYGKSFGASSFHYDDMFEELFDWELSLRSNSWFEFLVGDLQGPSHGIRAVTARQVASHPEYYAMNASRARQIPGLVDYPPQDLCYPYMTDEPGAREEHIRFLQDNYPDFTDVDYYTDYENKLFEENVKYAKTMFDVYNVTIVSVMPADGLTLMSDQCDFMVDEELSWHDYYSDYVWEYVNNVAWAIYEDPAYAGKFVSCSAYDPYSAPPKRLSKPIAPNLAVIVARQRNTFASESEPADSRDLTERWETLLASNNHLTGGEETNWLFSGDYYGNNRPDGGATGVPAIVPHDISEDFQYLKGRSKGEYMEINTVDTWPPFLREWVDGQGWVDRGWQSEWDAFAANSLNIYVIARLFWDADLDIDALLDEYYQLYYGPAAAAMQEFVEYSEENSINAFTDPTVVPTMRAMLDAARVLPGVTGDTDWGHRIDLLIGMMDSQFDIPDQYIDACQPLTIPYITYYLIDDVAAAGRCFEVQHHGITLDCQGHTITYAQSEPGQGVRDWYRDWLTIRNCNIVQATPQPDYSSGIYFYYSENMFIENTNITSYSSAIFLDREENVHVDSCVFVSDGSAIATQYVMNSTFTNNDLTSNQRAAMSFYKVNDSVVSGNIALSLVHNAISLSGSHNNVIADNYLETRSLSLPPISESEDSSGNVFDGNTLVAS